MSSSEEQTKESCKTMTESQKLRITQKPSTCHTSCSHIRYLMKRLITVLTKRLRKGRPSKYCRVCRAELRSVSRELMEKEKTSKANLGRFRRNQTREVLSQIRHQIQYKSDDLCDTSAFFNQSPMGRYQCHKCHREFARSNSLRRHLSSGVCKKDQKDTSESDQESVVSTKRSYGLGKTIFGKYDPDKLVEDGPTDNSTDEDEEDTEDEDDEEDEDEDDEYEEEEDEEEEDVSKKFI